VSKASFCDEIAEPSPTGRDAAGLLSRKVTGEVSEAAAALDNTKGKATHIPPANF